MLERHLLKLRVNQLFVQIVEADVWKMTDRVRNHIEETTLINCQTQVVEDINGAQKMSVQKNLCRKVRRPARCMAAALEKDVLANQHSFFNVGHRHCFSHGLEQAGVKTRYTGLDGGVKNLFKDPSSGGN